MRTFSFNYTFSEFYFFFNEIVFLYLSTEIAYETEYKLSEFSYMAVIKLTFLLWKRTLMMFNGLFYFFFTVCNFIVHERCVSNVVTPCSGIAPSIIKNPVAHCWSEPTHHKRKFCTVCRKRLDETPAVHCMSKYKNTIQARIET